jgi:type II secretory pathway component PulF
MEVSPRQLQLGRFWKKYLRLTRAGVPALVAFDVIVEEEPGPEFRAVIESLGQDVEKGWPLSEALAKFPAQFSRSTLVLIRTAEKQGHWDLVLEELANGLLEGTFE